MRRVDGVDRSGTSWRSRAGSIRTAAAKEPLAATRYVVLTLANRAPRKGPIPASPRRSGDRSRSRPLRTRIFNALESGTSNPNEPLPVPLSSDHTRPLKVLVAEDNRVNQRIFKQMLIGLDPSPSVSCPTDPKCARCEDGGFDPDGRANARDGWVGDGQGRASGIAGQDAPWIVAVTANCDGGDRPALLGGGHERLHLKPSKWNTSKRPWPADAWH